MILNRDARIEMLRRLPLFADLRRRSLATIASLVDDVTVPAGKVLIRDGGFGREFFVLVQGAVAIEGSDGESSLIGPGEFFGEGGLLTGGRSSASAIATQPSRLIVMTDRAFRSLLSACPVVELRVLRAATERIAGEAGLRAAGPPPRQQLSGRWGSRSRSEPRPAA